MNKNSERGELRNLVESVVNKKNENMFQELRNKLLNQHELLIKLNTGLTPDIFTVIDDAPYPEAWKSDKKQVLLGSTAISEMVYVLFKIEEIPVVGIDALEDALLGLKIDKKKFFFKRSPQILLMDFYRGIFTTVDIGRDYQLEDDGYYHLKKTCKDKNINKHYSQIRELKDTGLAPLILLQHGLVHYEIAGEYFKCGRSALAKKHFEQVVNILQKVIQKDLGNLKANSLLSDAQEMVARL